MAERADEYQNKSFLSQTNGRTHEATYGGSTLPNKIDQIVQKDLIPQRPIQLVDRSISLILILLFGYLETSLTIYV